MRIDKKKVFTLFALTVLVLSLLLVNMNLPTGAQVTPQPIYLHGPSLTPIHMNSNITLTPVHMHHTGGVLQWGDDRLYEPNCTTDWTRLYPNPDLYTEYHLSSWEDTYPDGMLSPNDQIDMTDPDQNVTWYHVDRMTVTLLLSPLPPPNPPPLPPYEPWPGTAEPTIAIELKWPVYFPEIKHEENLPPYMNSTWHEVWPSYSNIYNLTSWMENPQNPTFILDKCDVVDLTDPNTGAVTWWHVEDIATDLILREKIMDPKCTWWHEIYPEYCNWHHLTSWEDFGWPYGMLSPSDQIDMIEEESGITTWYHVDRVTVTLNVTLESDPTEWMKIELKTHYFEEMYEVFKYPWFSLWHEVYPRYSNVYNLTDWDPWVDDNCNFVLDPCDYIWLQNMTSGDLAAKPERWHIEDMTYDLILNKKISDPVCTDWHALYPPEEYCNWYHVDEWNDTQPEGQLGHGLLSPCDYVNLTLAGGPTEEYHVENVTITLNVAPWEGPGEIMLIEAMALFEEMYLPKTEPWAFEWHEVWPIFSLLYYIEPDGWEDNCNGVLDYCDNVTLLDVTGFPTKWHVEEVAVDMVVKKIVEQPPPPPPVPPMYWKANYTDYAPSGVPDFNQRQDLFNLTGMWTWCVPTAVANSLWWMDSRFDFHPNGSRLVTNYTAGIDDHDPQNVQPFIKHLAYLMDTDGIRTQTLKLGTLVSDSQTGIAHYLSWTGVNPLGDVNGDGVTNQTDYNIAFAANNTQPGQAGWNMAADVYPVTLGWPTPGTADNVVNQSDLDLINAHMNETGMFYEKTVKTPDFEFVENEVLRSEDVILLLDFYNPDFEWQKTTDPLKELGHAVTVAGVNSTSQPPRIAISDPDNDNAEPPPQGTSGPGRVLPPGVPHVHNATPPHTLHNNASYVSHDIYNVTFIFPPPHISNASWALDKYPGPIGTVAVVEWAIIVSPRPVEEVCGVDITNVVPTFKGLAVNGTYVTWTITVNVTVHSNGTMPINCTVSAYYFNATVTNQINITKTVLDLSPCNNITLQFNWNMSGFPVNTTYTVKANATCTCGASDEFINGPLKVRFAGDIDDNDRISIADVKIMDNAYSGVPGVPALYLAFSDIDGNCRISIADAKIMDNVYSGLPYP